MTTPDQKEHELQGMLQRHADRVDVPGDFASVAIARRRRDQRNRAALGAAAAVAVIAVAVPTLWSPGRGTAPVPGLTSSSTSVASSTSSVPTESPSSPPATTPAGTESPAPPTNGSSQVATRETAYAQDDTIRFGDTVFRLEKGTVVENFAVLADGGFVVMSHMSTGSSQSVMEILSPKGRLIGSLGVSGTYAVSPDGTRVLAKSGDSDTLAVYAADGRKLAERKDPREVGAIVGDVAYLNGDASQGSLEWDVQTDATRKLPAHVVAVSPDRTRAALQWFVATDAMDDACWAVVDLTKATFPKTVERCGKGENPAMFMPTAFSAKGTYLVGSHYVDGGFWFSAGVVRVADGTTVLGGDGAKVVSGWSWHLDADETTFRISRNTTPVLASPPSRNAVQECTLEMQCSETRPELDLGSASFTEPRYVVPR